MQRLRLLTLIPLALWTACAPRESGLRVKVTVRAQGTARVRADCIKLTISNDTQELKSATIKRPTDDDAIFGVRRGTDLPTTVKLQASGYIGANCADDVNLKLNAQGSIETATFPEEGVTELEVFVDPPGVSLDADRDGYVAASKGGLDCKDDDASIFPGAVQLCANTSDTDCDGQGGCDDTECGSATVCLDPPDRVAVTTSIATMLRYECRGPFRVELRNAAGVRTAIRDTAVALTSSLPGVTVHATSSCGDTAVTSLPIPYGGSFFEVYLKADGQAFGNTTLTATAARVMTPGTASVEVHPQPLDHLEFTTPVRTVSAGECSTDVVTVEFRDAMNRRTDVDSPTTITMTSTPGDLGNANIFFSDAACATSSSMGQLLRGQGALSLRVKVSRAGTFTLTATPSAGTGTSQQLTVAPATGTKLAFTNTPIYLNTTEQCSLGLFTVQLQDSFSNPVTTTANLPVRVTVNTLTAVQVFDPSGNCNTAATNEYVIPAGSNSFSFRARGMTAPPFMGSVTVIVTNGAPITPATQDLTIRTGYASKFQLSGLAANPLAGDCSQNPFSVELLDAANNPATSMTATVFTLSTLPVLADPSFKFYAGAGCVTPLTGTTLTVPAGVQSATFSYQGNKAAAFEIRASTAVLSPPGTFLPGNSIRPGPPGKLVFTAPLTQTAQAGVCTPGPYVANVLDLFDNITSFTSGQVVSVSSTPTVGAGVTVGATTCASGNTVALAQGATSVSFNAQHTATGSYALTATVGGFSTATAANLTVTPAPSTLTFDAPAMGTTLMAGGCQQITLSRRDTFNNNAPTTSAITLGLPPNTTLFTNSTCTTGMGTVPALSNSHTVTFWALVRTAGVHQLTASLVATGQAAVPVSLTVTPATPTLVFTQPNTDAGTAAAAQVAGGCTPVTILRRDPYANDVPLGAAGNVTFTLPGGTTAHSNTPCSVGNAVTMVPVAGTAASASFYVSATVSSPGGGPAAQNVVSQLGGQTANLTLTVSPGAPTLVMTAPASSTQTLMARECLTVTLLRRDNFMNPVPVSGAGAVTISPAGPTLYGSANCTSPGVPVPVGAFSSTFSLNSSLAAASTAYTLTMDGQTVPLTLTINPGPTSKLLVEGLPANLTARTCAGPLTVRRQDADSNNVTGEPGLAVTLASTRFLFSSVAGCAGATAGASVSIANGASVSAEPLYAIATQAGAATATATATAPSGVVTGSASSTITAGPASKLVFLDPPPGPATSGICSGMVVTSRVELRDQDENPVTPTVAAPVTVTLASSPGSPTFSTGSTCAGALPLVLTNAARVGTFSFRATTAPATETITASSGSLTPASQDWTINVGVPTKMAWKQTPVSPAARFTCVSAGVIQLQDTNSNVSPNPGGTITVTPTPSTPSSSGMTFFSDNTCATPISTLSIANGASETAEFFMLATGGTPVNVSATSSPAYTAPPVRAIALTGTGSYAVTPPTPALEAGACVALTVERRDAAATPFSKGASSVNLTTATPAMASLHLLSDCTDTVAQPVNRVIAHGSSTTIVYVRGRSAAPVSNQPVDVAFTAAEALGGTAASTSGTTTLKVYPLVRRGSCNIADTALGARCAVSPGIPGDVITRSFLVFSSTGSTRIAAGGGETKAEDQDVECHLENSSGVEVVCSRVGTAQPMSVNYQVVSFGRDAASTFGVSVQRATFATTGATTTTTLTTPVNTAKSFILASNTMSGNDNNGDAFPLVRFASTGASVNSVEVVANTGTPARTVSIEVVTLGFAGAVVEHVNNTNPTQTSGGYSIATTGTAVASTFALAMAQVSSDTTDFRYMCKRRLNVKVGANAVTMHRGGIASPSANCTTDAVVATTVQRVTVGNGVVRVPGDALFNANNTPTITTAGTFTAIAPHKSITFLMMQGPGGQTAGESDFGAAANDGDDTGTSHALLDFNATFDKVSVTRTITGTNNTSVFSPIVVQFDP